MAPRLGQTEHVFVTEAPLEPQDALLEALDYLRVMVLRQAWNDKLTLGAITELRERIRGAALSQLSAHGLAGVHLDMKRGIIRELDRQYRQEKDRRTSMLGSIAAAFDGLLRRRRLEGDLLGKIFETLKSLIGSVLAALGIKGPLDELIDFVAACITQIYKRVRRT